MQQQAQASPDVQGEQHQQGQARQSQGLGRHQPEQLCQQGGQGQDPMPAACPRHRSHQDGEAEIADPAASGPAARQGKTGDHSQAEEQQLAVKAVPLLAVDRSGPMKPALWSGSLPFG